MDSEAVLSGDREASHGHSLLSMIGAVIIGRNEGKNLGRCLTSLRGCRTVVYVDSGSTDGSTAIAAGLGADVVELDMRIPFTAARARNAGFRRLCALNPEIKYVQFVDGDCEIVPGWIPRALEFLEANGIVAVVCGRRFERYPEASIYNAMCNREWDTPIGEASACGGDSLTRIAALRAVGGYTESLVAHEEPELCGRLRKAGWKIWRIDQPMTLHDAAIYRLSQFYKRCRRGAFGVCQCLFTPGCYIDPHGRAIIVRAFTWSMILPVVIVILSVLIGPYMAIAFLIYPVQILRHALSSRFGVGKSAAQRLYVAAISMVEKFAATQGCIEFFLRSIAGMKERNIYYK